MARRWLPFNLAALSTIFIPGIPVWAAGLVIIATGGATSVIMVRRVQKGWGAGSFRKLPMDPALLIANQTLPYLRRGLNEYTAGKTVEIIREIADVAAVAITDREKVLAYIGAGSDHHKAGGPIMTDATKNAVNTGVFTIIKDRYGLTCPQRGCPLESAVIAPFRVRGEVAGAVKLYRVKRGHVPLAEIKLAEGVAQILGLQMELADLDRQAQLLINAELDTLQAQINPHFLFNTLNTISMFIRTNPEAARRLLVRLASFFRYAMKRHRHFNTVKEEIEYMNTYVILEKARFRDKLRIVKRIDKELYDYNVPALIIQPLVENAIKHGILPREGKGTVTIRARLEEDAITFQVEDDGVGIPPHKIPMILKPGFGSGNGVGLSNVHERLKLLYGGDHGLDISSVPGAGTKVMMKIPLNCKSSRQECGLIETQGSDNR